MYQTIIYGEVVVAATREALKELIIAITESHVLA